MSCCTLNSWPRKNVLRIWWKKMIRIQSNFGKNWIQTRYLPWTSSLLPRKAPSRCGSVLVQRRWASLQMKWVRSLTDSVMLVYCLPNTLVCRKKQREHGQSLEFCGFYELSSWERGEENHVSSQSSISLISSLSLLEPTVTMSRLTNPHSSLTAHCSPLTYWLSLSRAHGHSAKAYG